MKLLLALPVLLAATTPGHAEQAPESKKPKAHLIIQSAIRDRSNALTVHSVPMETIEQCEESGAALVASKRLQDFVYIAYECLESR